MGKIKRDQLFDYIIITIILIGTSIWAFIGWVFFKDIVGAFVLLCMVKMIIAALAMCMVMLGAKNISKKFNKEN